MKNPAVSVIIPVYNTEEFLDNCILSVLQQTFADIQIVCVNDGSTDGSGLILEKYANLDDRVLLVEKPNGGLSSARNAGLAVATGKYIEFLDSDDMIKPHTIEECFSVCESKGLDAVFFDAETEYETESLRKLYPHYETYYHRSNDYHGVIGGRSLFVSLIKNNEFRSSVNLAMFSHDYLLRKELEFIDGIYYEDNVFMFQLLIADPISYKLDSANYIRVVREGSIISAKPTQQHLFSAQFVFKYLLKYVEENSGSWPQELKEASNSHVSIMEDQYQRVRSLVPTI